MNACRTARKVHGKDFQRALNEIRTQFVREHAQKQQQNDDDVVAAALGNDQIHVYVRKRPLLPHELEKSEFDVISSIGKREIVIHECKMYNGTELFVLRYARYPVALC